jgi:3-oxoacyl-[acyl-carrier-protein] synthase III
LDTGAQTLAQAKLDASHLDWLIPHQANVRILNATARRLGVYPPVGLLRIAEPL